MRSISAIRQIIYQTHNKKPQEELEMWWKIQLHTYVLCVMRWRRVRSTQELGKQRREILSLSVRRHTLVSSPLSPDLTTWNLIPNDSLTPATQPLSHARRLREMSERVEISSWVNNKDTCGLPENKIVVVRHSSCVHGDIECRHVSEETRLNFFEARQQRTYTSTRCLRLKCQRWQTEHSTGLSLAKNIKCSKELKWHSSSRQMRAEKRMKTI